MTDSKAKENTTKTVFESPPQTGGHRMNELYNRYRRIAIELSGLSLTELAGKSQGDAIETQILNDFINFKEKYKTDD